MTPNGNFFEYLAQEIRRTPEVAGRYASSTRLRLWERLALLGTLRGLHRLAAADLRSSELLCYGWHIRARRCHE